MHLETAHVLAGLIESLPLDIPLDDPEPDPEGAPETGSARSAREKRDAAQRKLDERARNKALGIPDPRTVDAMVIAALAEICRRRNFTQIVFFSPTEVGTTSALIGVQMVASQVTGSYFLSSP